MHYFAFIVVTIESIPAVLVHPSPREQASSTNAANRLITANDRCECVQDSGFTMLGAAYEQEDFTTFSQEHQG